MNAPTRRAVMSAINARTDGPASVAAMMTRMQAAGIDVATRFAGASSSVVDHAASGGIARAGLCRTVPFTLSRDVAAGDAGAEGVDDGRTIDGYGAVFETYTEINSWEGHFQEKIRQGAFKKSIRESTPKMQFDHGMHPLLGGLPLGRWTTVEEDTHGLHVVGRLRDDWLVEPFRMAIAEGDVDGMSFRFSVVKEEWRDAQDKVIKDDMELFELLYYGSDERGPITRTLIEVRCQEVGPVVWPAYAETEVGARSNDGGSLIIDLGALRNDRAALADIVALVDGEAARARRLDVVASLSARVADAGGDSGTGGVHNGTVHTGHARSTEGHSEPQATGSPAGDHAHGAPVTTGGTAGQHSRSGNAPDETRPLNTPDRRDAIRDGYRKYLDRTLVLPPSD